MFLFRKLRKWGPIKGSAADQAQDFTYQYMNSHNTVH